MRLRDRARRRRWTPGRWPLEGEPRIWRTAISAALGFRVVASEYRPRGGAGEIDSGRAGMRETLVFVEVKSRSQRRVRHARTAPSTQAKRDAAGACGPGLRPPGGTCRGVESAFDLVNVIFSRPPGISHIKAAFRAGQAYNTSARRFRSREDLPDCLNCAKTPSPAAG